MRLRAAKQEERVVTKIIKHNLSRRVSIVKTRQLNFVVIQSYEISQKQNLLSYQHNEMYIYLYFQQVRCLSYLKKNRATNNYYNYLKI